MSAGGRRNKGSGNNKNEDSEVEELLRAAEDDMILNLSIHSHTSRSNPFDADLARRFEALKMPKPASSSNITKSPKPNEEEEEEEERQVTTGSISSLQVDENLKMILGFDLSARFAALRKGSSSSSSSIPSKDVQGHSGKSNDYDDDEDDDEVDGEGVSKKEVDKLIQWAMDAARLDPSISSDDDGGGDDDSYIDEEEEEEDKKKKKKKKKKGGIKKKKE